MDEAYALLIETDGDPDISRQKDDLRLLIAKRILTVYSSKQTVTTGKRSEIPLVINADVQKEIRLFQSVEKDFFMSSYQRSFLYRPIIVRELKKAGLPEELSWLPLVESGFKVAALSRARALGLWQFIPSTGYKFDLDRDDWIDERMDVEKSTLAAISYLKELHGMFGDWLTVLAAYNCGEGRVLKVISRQHINYFDRFWDLYHQLPYETARYVPRFLATLQIIKDPKKFGMDLGDSSPQNGPCPYEIVKTSKSMSLTDIATHLGVSDEILVALNSELRHKVTPSRDYDLKVPLEMAEKFVKIEGEIPQWDRPKPPPVVKKTVTLRHRVKKGETIVSLSRKYRISAAAILSYNHISSRAGLKKGQVISIPIRSYRYDKSQETVKGASYNNKPTQGDIVKYQVKKGDTLASIAGRHDMSIADLKKLNHLRSNTIQKGQFIKISAQGELGRAEAPASKKMKKNQKSAVIKNSKGQSRNTAGQNNEASKRTYTVKKGDTLRSIAMKNNVTIVQIQQMNRLRNQNILQPGQIIMVE